MSVRTRRLSASAPALGLRHLIQREHRIGCAFACPGHEQGPIGHSVETLAVVPQKGVDRAS
jgi:hypothetical protein